MVGQVSNEAIADCIDAAHDVLLVTGWGQKRTTLDDGRKCVVGAVLEVRGTPARVPALHCIATELGCVVPDGYDAVAHIVRFNDDPRRNADEVFDLLRRTAKKLREQVQQ